MRYLRLLQPDNGPRDGIPYTDPRTGWTSRGKTLTALYAAARLHRESNNIPIPDDFELQIETQWCMANPDLCVGRDGLPSDTSCQYRGELLRWEGCSSCGGVRAKIMACSKHGECTEFKHQIGSIRRCAVCPDRKTELTDTP